MKFIELFAGIGGFRYGLEKVGRVQQGMEQSKGGRCIEGNRCRPQYNNERWVQKQESKNQPNIESREGFYCVWANEWDKYAAQIYRRRFGDKDSGQCRERSRSPECLRPRGDSPHSQGKSREDNQGSNWHEAEERKDNQPQRDISNTPKRGPEEVQLQPANSGGYWHEPSKLYEGDIRAVDPATIPDHDLLCAGFPCQSFSIAGKRGGFADTRGTLFFEICRILQVKRPPLLLLENVKGLLSHDAGDTYETILRTLDELGYDCEWEVLNSKHYGVPQNRERVFIIGHLRGQPRPKVFPLGETDQVYPEPDRQISHAIDSNYHKGWLDNQQRAMVRTRSDQQYQEKEVTPPLRQSDKAEVRVLHNIYGGFNETEPRVFTDECPTLRTPKGGGHLPVIIDPFRMRTEGKPRVYEGVCPSLQGRDYKEPRIVASRGRNPDNPSGKWKGLTERRTAKGKEMRKESRKKGRDWSPRRGKEVVARDDDMLGAITATPTVENTLTNSPDNWLAQNQSIRRLTPIECERLQGFPDGWTQDGLAKDGEQVDISDTQRYKCLGNAVTTNVITAIGRQLLEGLGKL